MVPRVSASDHLGNIHRAARAAHIEFGGLAGGALRAQDTPELQQQPNRIGQHVRADHRHLDSLARVRGILGELHRKLRLARARHPFDEHQPAHRSRGQNDARKAFVQAPQLGFASREIRRRLALVRQVLFR